MRTIVRWIDERWQVSPILAGFVDRQIPRGVGWFHTLGSATLFLIIVQFATGIVLSISYVPSVEHAYHSVLFIDQTPFGALVRATHHWAAGLLVIVISLHALRVFAWAAYKYPREINWVAGALLFFVTLGFAFTGYLLPWDQKAYWATVVGTNIAGQAPVIGGAALELLRGGEQLGAATLVRFYGIHIWILPAALLGLVGVHLFGVIRQGIAAPPRAVPLTTPIPGESRRQSYEREYAAEKRIGKPFREALLADAIVAALLLVAVFALAILAGAPLDAPADPNAVGYVPRPEWYFLSLFQLLFFFGGPFESVLIFVVMTGGVLLFILVPFLDRNPRLHPRRRPVALGLMGVTVAGVLVLTYLGATGAAGLPEVPARAGMSDPVLAGLRVYNAQGCASCHALDGVGGSTGPDLSRAGFRWEVADIRRQIVTPKNEEMPAYNHIAPDQFENLVTFLESLK